MDSLQISFWVVALLVALALAFDFMNGFHDAANSIATVVSTGVLKPGQAVALHPFDDDGLGVGYLPLAPHAELQLSRHAASQGVFVFVLQGQLVLGAQTLQPWELFFVSRDEPMPACQAGAQGALVLSLHCPPRETVYQESLA